MKKKWIAAVLCFSVLTTLTGPFVKADDTVQEESILEKYEHQHRISGKRYIGRPPLHLRAETEVKVLLMRSARRRNCSISQSFWQRMPLVITGENITF